MLLKTLKRDYFKLIFNVFIYEIFQSRQEIKKENVNHAQPGENKRKLVDSFCANETEKTSQNIFLQLFHSKPSKRKRKKQSFAIFVSKRETA